MTCKQCPQYIVEVHTWLNGIHTIAIIKDWIIKDWIIKDCIIKDCIKILLIATHIMEIDAYYA